MEQIRSAVDTGELNIQTGVKPISWTTHVAGGTEGLDGGEYSVEALDSMRKMMMYTYSSSDPKENDEPEREHSVLFKIL